MTSIKIHVSFEICCARGSKYRAFVPLLIDSSPAKRSELITEILGNF